MTIAVHQWNTFLEYSVTDENGPFAELVEVTKIMPPKKKGAKVDASHLRSPHRTKEFIAGWVDPGDAGFTCHYSSDAYQTLETLRSPADDVPPTTVFFRLNLPLEPGAANNAYLPFTGQINGLSFTDFEVADRTVDLEIEIAVSEIGEFVPAS